MGFYSVILASDNLLFEQVYLDFMLTVLNQNYYKTSQLNWNTFIEWYADLDPLAPSPLYNAPAKFCLTPLIPKVPNQSIYDP